MPTLNSLVLTENIIERKAERLLDQLDKEFLNTKMTREEYDLQVQEINAWVNKQWEEYHKANPYRLK